MHAIGITAAVLSPLQKKEASLYSPGKRVIHIVDSGGTQYWFAVSGSKLIYATRYSRDGELFYSPSGILRQAPYEWGHNTETGGCL